MSELTKLAFEIAAKDTAWPILPIIMADIHSGEIVYISKFAEDIFGYETNELLGQTIEVLIPESVRESHARWRQDASVPKMRMMGVGRQIVGRRKNGNVFPLHIGLTTVSVMERVIGVALTIDLTGIVELKGVLA